MGLFDLKLANKTPAGVAECEKQIAEVGVKRKEIIHQIGAMFVEANTPDGISGTVYEKPLRELERMEEAVKNLEKRKLALQGLRRCEKCGHTLEVDSAFCNKCGERLDKIELTTDGNEITNKCPKCGTNYEDDAAFCTSCGIKLR